MKIIITGGAGFIGHHLVNRLVSEGHEVVVLDNFSSGKKENVNKKAKLIEGDIRDASDVKSIIKNCNYVFHLAAISEARSGNDSLVYNTNFIGSKNVFEAAKEAGAKIIFTSSAAVYGNEAANEDGTCSPVSQYGKSKLKAERSCPTGSFIARLFNVYGPRGNSVVNKFSRLIPNYKPVEVFGRGTQTRDYIHVDDVVNALVLGIGSEGVYNVGTGKETSVLEIADLVGNISKSRMELKFAPLPKSDVLRSMADASKIAELGWEPKISLEKGVEDTIIEEGTNLEAIRHLR